MATAPELIVFLGGMSGSDIESMLAEALAEAALDLLEEAESTDAFSRLFLVTDSDALADRLPATVVVDRDSQRHNAGRRVADRHVFHFGQRLASLIRDYEIERPVYAGAGAAPLLRGSDLAGIARHVAAAKSTVVSNNYFSADLVAFTPGESIHAIELPPSDNLLPRLLHDQAGLESQPLPRSTATQFNIDSPADLAILSVAGGAGPNLSRWLAKRDFDVAAYRSLMQFVVDPTAEVILAGRVGSQVWSHLEKETACQLRVFSEERGMRAAGRDASGDARSLLAFHLREVGCERFFRELGEMGDAACIDTRPLLAHLGVQPSRADRFWSDLGSADNIKEPLLREFTEGAGNAPIPVVLGGHSLIAGGLMLLTDAAWRAEDQRLLVKDSGD